MPLSKSVDSSYGFENVDDVALPNTHKQSSEPADTDIRQELGLLMSQQLTDIHGGEITIQGSQNHGYRYVVTLPPFEVD